MATLASLSKEVPMGRDYVGAKEVYLFAEITYLRIKGSFGWKMIRNMTRS